jgi:hypothetical protein
MVRLIPTVLVTDTSQSDEILRTTHDRQLQPISSDWCVPVHQLDNWYLQQQYNYCCWYCPTSTHTTIILLLQKPSIIRFQLIHMSNNPDRNMNNSVHSWVRTLRHMWDFEARGIRTRGLSDCWGQMDRLKPRKKLSNTGFSWLNETLHFSFWQGKKLLW